MKEEHKWWDEESIFVGSGIARGTSCGFYRPPSLSYAANDIVKNKSFIPCSKLPKLHTWKIAKVLPKHL